MLLVLMWQLGRKTRAKGKDSVRGDWESDCGYDILIVCGVAGCIVCSFTAEGEVVEFSLEGAIV